MSEPHLITRPDESADRIDQDRETWSDCAVAGCDVQDAQLGRSVRTLLESLRKGIGKSIPFACEDWGIPGD